MQCRSNCGACCIAPSISSPIPGMPEGKLANQPCLHLNSHYQCQLFNQPERPSVCVQLQPCLTMCGSDRLSALSYLIQLERDTAP